MRFTVKYSPPCGVCEDDISHRCSLVLVIPRRNCLYLIVRVGSDSIAYPFFVRLITSMSFSKLKYITLSIKMQVVCPDLQPELCNCPDPLFQDLNLVVAHKGNILTYLPLLTGLVGSFSSRYLKGLVLSRSLNYWKPGICSKIRSLYRGLRLSMGL